MKPHPATPTLRYAILLHETSPAMNRPTHWDLLLEDHQNDRLATWSLPQQPDLGIEMACEQLPRHRKLYLDYEGPISGDRGKVSRWDVGNVQWLQDTADHIRVELTLGRMAGIIDLTRKAAGWRFRHHVST